MNRSRRSHFFWTMPLLLAVPWLGGAKGEGCAPGGILIVGSGPDAGGSCVPDDCKGLPATNEARFCADGTSLGRTECNTLPSGKCGWDFPACPVSDAGSSVPPACARDKCIGKPVLDDAKLCADGTALGRTECAPSADGTCDWTFPACNGECTLKDCEGKPSLTDAKICADGTSLGRSLCAQYPNGVCGWDFPACPTP